MPILSRSLNKPMYFKSRLGSNVFMGTITDRAKSYVYITPTHELDGNGRMVPTKGFACQRKKTDLFDTLDACLAGPLPSPVQYHDT